MTFDFPDLTKEKVIAIDVETNDPDLKEKGPGTYTNGYVVGLAVGVPGREWYFPFKHERGQNLPEQSVKNWALDNLCNGGVKVGANLLYDLEYLHRWGVPVNGRFEDVQVAEPLLDENAFSYALGTLGEKYLGEGKDENALYEYAASQFGGKPTRNQQGKNIWRCPSDIVAPYAMSDVRLPLLILEKQKEAMRLEFLDRVWDLETRLIPLLLAMRQRGVRVDVSGSDALRAELANKLALVQLNINRLCDREVNINAAASIAEAFDGLGIPYPRTEKTGKPSFTKPWLESHAHPVAKLITEARGLGTLISTFLDGYVFGHHVNGRLHTQFNQLRGDEYGTVSGRFSSSNPNLQNIPSRTETGKLVRGLFLPEPGEHWYKLDYSQIEPRLVLHFAYGRDEIANRVVEEYQRDPSIDCYNAMMQHIPGVSRANVKTIYLGMVYGMGKAKLAASLNMEAEEAAELFELFHQGAPYVNFLSKDLMVKAASRGHICTLSGRRARFVTWESANYKEKGLYNSQEEALEEHTNVKRAFTYKALNRLIQGSAADVMKKAMLRVHESGVMDVLGAPLLTVHDELDFSVPDSPEGREAIVEARNIMEKCVNTRVPMRVDIEKGDSWGTVEVEK